MCQRCFFVVAAGGSEYTYEDDEIISNTRFLAYLFG